MNKRDIIFRASSADRLYSCPGSHWATFGLVEAPEMASPASVAGTNTHAVMHKWLDNIKAYGISVPLPNTEDKDALELAGKFLDKAQTASFPTPDRWHMEEQMLDTELGYSGRPDFYAVGADLMAVLLDWKCGYSEKTGPAESIQLRIYATMLMRETGCTNVTAYVAEPFRPWRETKFMLADLRVYEDELRRIRKRSLRKNAKRKTGPQCRYCLANGNPTRCPESCALTVLEGDLPARPADVAKALEQWKRLKPMGDRLEALARQMIDSGTAIPGWEIGPSSQSVSIPDVNKAWDAVADTMTAGQFALCCKGVSLPDLAEVYAAEHDIDAKTAREALIIKLGDAIETTTKRGSLRKVKDND